MTRIIALVLLLLSAPAIAAERVLVLDDNDAKVLYQILDEATKARGIAIAPATAYILDKLNKAPVVTERKDPPAPAEEKMQ